MKNLILPIALIAMSLPTFAADVNLTLQPEQELNRIDEKIYSHFLEHIYNSVNGGLWGDLVWNRSFEDNAGGQPPEDSNANGWSKKDNIITQSSLNVNQRIIFGEEHWTDYELSLEAQKTGGADAIFVMFRVQNNAEYSWLALGGWGNRQHAIERRNAQQSQHAPVSPMIMGSLETGKWYTINIRCKGNNVKVSLDGQQIFDITDPGMAKTGGVGIGTWVAQAQFRNIKVTSLDGQTVLYNEMPEITQPLRVGYWNSFGIFGSVSLNLTDSLNGKASVQIDSRGRQAVGIRQGGFDLKRRETYLVSCWTKQIRGVADGATLHLRFSRPEGGGFHVLEKNAANEWTRISAEFTPDRDMSEAILELFTLGTNATVLVDQVSIMPKSWAANGGFRPDLLQAIGNLKPPVIRYPGGCYASAYRWKDGIGPQEKRGPHPFSIWDDRDVNSFGTDEFIKMCRLVGSEPLIVINTGSPPWNVRRTPATANVDWVREACDWLEYCNGPATSKWGKVRAENGHPEPYNVRYWEIDNESEASAEEYVADLKKFVPALKKVDPTIKIIACGSWRGDRLNWDSHLINEAGELFDYLSFHQYDDPNVYADGPGRIETYFRSVKEVIDKSPNKNIKIFDSEWNAQSTDWRTGLYAGGILNVFERCGDFVEMAAPALFLRHARARDWDNAFINFDNKSWYPAPNYVVMKLWREHYAPIRIGLDGDTKGLNVVATKPADGKTLYFKAVNPTNEMRSISLNVGRNARGATLKLITARGLNDRNTLENPDTIAPKDGTTKLDGNTVRFELPAYSAGAATVEL